MQEEGTMALIKPIVTVNLFALVPAGKIFATGIAPDSPEGLNMTGGGRMLAWIAKKGEANDWCVYTHYSSHDIDFLSMQGDKVHDRKNIDNILLIDDYVWEKYRL